MRVRFSWNNKRVAEFCARQVCRGFAYPSAAPVSTSRRNPEERLSSVSIIGQAVNRRSRHAALFRLVPSSR